MQGLENLNGQQAAIDGVLAKYASRQKEIVTITGVPGVGVTWTLQRAAEHWESSGGLALHARGEPLAADRKLFPWLTLALPGAKRLARLAVLKAGVTHGSRSIPLVGAVTSYIVDELLNYRKKRLAREAIVIGEQEQDLLYVIQNAARQKRLLLAIDNLNAWDQASWNLLGLVLSSSLDEFYPSLKDALVLVGASREVPTRLRSLGSHLGTAEFHIMPLERRYLPVALSTFQLNVSSQEALDRIYEITDARLDLLCDLATHLRQTNPDRIDDQTDGFYTRMIERRIQDTGPDTHALQELLAAAAVLGQIFTFDDIQCVTGFPMERLDSAVQLAIAQHFVSTIGQTIQFRSSALHQFFHREYSADHATYHSKFAECLKAMRPGEYAYRMRHLILADRIEDALSCYALAVLAAVRTRGCEPDPGSLRTAPGWKEVSEYLDTMRRAYEHYLSRQLSRCTEILDTVEGFLPDALAAERDCLESQILLESHRMSDFHRAVELLGHRDYLQKVEADLWTRIGHVLVVAYVQTGQTEKALALEKELTAQYWNRRRLDPSALYGLNVLRRRAECIHRLPTATLRLESAVAYFGPRDPGVLPRHPADYYYSLNNLVGNLLASGRFKDAYERAVELDQLVHDHSSFRWPILELPANNYVLASYLADRISAADAVGAMEKVLEAQDGTGDHVLMENNHAVFLVHADRRAEAASALSNVYKRITSDGEPDPYHRYFVGNNLAGLLAVGGKLPEARELFLECEPLLHSFYPAIQQTMRRRHELIRPALQDAAELGVTGFDQFLRDRHQDQLGPQWVFYGRGFLLTDIQFWGQD